MSELNQFPHQNFTRRRAMRPTAGTWLKHSMLLLATFVTATIAGVLPPFGIIQLSTAETEPQTWGEIFQLILLIPVSYLSLVSFALQQIFTNLEYLNYGLSFSLSLLFILASHEAGHYIACRIYGVDATLPYFIPTPPMIGPAGTFGAFIKILSPMPSRRAVFDIGVAGPIAGFIAMIPIAVIGVATRQPATPEQLAESQFGIVFSDALLMKVLAYFWGIDLSLSFGNAFYFAAWMGLLVTALNLLPSGQLDGGHAIYAALGEKIHFWTGRIAFIVMTLLSILGWFIYNSPAGFLLAVLLFFMMRIPHPEPLDAAPLDLKRKIIAVLTLLIFILCLMPFPIKVL